MSSGNEALKAASSLWKALISSMIFEGSKLPLASSFVFHLLRVRDINQTLALGALGALAGCKETKNLH